MEWTVVKKISTPDFDIEAGERSVTSSVMNLTGHKDESICRMLAEDVCRTCGKTVVCTGGVHLENITVRQMNRLWLIADQLEKLLLEDLK